MSVTAYAVGDVLYVLSKKKNSIYSVRVSEEIFKKTLQGAQRTFSVQSSPDSEPIDLSKLEGVVFSDLSELQNYMEQNAKAAIARLVLAAAQEAKEKFHQEVSDSSESTQQIEPEIPDDDVPRVVLSDGTVARVRGFSTG